MNVVDASVALKWVYEEPGSAQAHQVLGSEPSLAAPAFWLVEVANGLRRRMAEGRLSRSDVEDRLAFLRSLPIVVTDTLDLLDEGLALAFALRHPLCDCLYLALTLRRNGLLFTADDPFRKACARGGYGERIAFVGPGQP